ncbi:MAG: coproporphyrinogen dehydrogenase HemZ [Lachnospiraceae bacterium]|nr:coproporphyrinogen dehydrogenase HemZ [Lachnospiraceae bacterium]
MIYVYITKELRPFETDIRDLCLAFFTLQKITYIFDDVGADTICQCEGRACELRPYSSPDIVVKDYYNGTLDADRLTVKSEVKRQLYNYLSKLTGKKLLWGTLTGIRPVNIVTSMLEERARETRPCDGGSASVRPYEYSVRPCDEERHNRQPVAASCTSGKSVRDVMGLSPLTEIDNPIYKENEKIKEYLKKEYYISDEKGFELIKIARNEIKILERPEVRDYKNSYSVYVGVPFCKSTCLYCSFTSFNIEKFGKYVDRYLETIERDFNSRVGKIVGKRALQAFAPTNTAFTSTDKLQPLTLYIGGGTPTSLDENAFERLLTIIDKYVDRSKCIEYTVEAGRPDTITKEKLLIMKRHGVSRISINPQSFNQKTLDLIGRKHTVEDVIEKFKLARELGFDNINMDIILGLPNEHLFDVLKTLNGVRKLKPDSFTVHSLALKRAARLNFELAEWTKNYYLAGVGKREIDSMFKWSERLAEHLKLKPYYLYRQKNIAGNLENVGYAKEGKECIYNIMMMSERHSVYGFGTATTKEVFYENGGKRIESEEGYKSVIDYCERVGS